MRWYCLYDNCLPRGEVEVIGGLGDLGVIGGLRGFRVLGDLGGLRVSQSLSPTSFVFGDGS